MRRYLIVGMAVSALLGLTATAIAANVQTIDGKVKPKKLHEEKFDGVKLAVTTEVRDADDPTATPTPATRALLKFKKRDFRFDTSEAKRCKKEKIDGTTTEAAIDACGRAIVGKGEAGVRFAGIDLDGTVTVFNGQRGAGTARLGSRAKRNPTLLLHTFVPAAATATVLTGVLKERGKAYKLDVTVPPLTGGAAITRFHTKVKKGDYVQARCKKGKIKLVSRFTYVDGTKLKATDNHRCRQK